jgi:dipeptidyl aminopeptidase/acylaminoacyl peptidase
VLFTHWGNDRGISRVSLSGTDRTAVVPEGGSGLVTTSGHLLYVQVYSPWAGILAAPYTGRAVAAASAKLVLSDFFFVLWEPDPWVSVSSNGTLAYVPSRITERSLVIVDESGRGVPATEQRGLYGSLALSPDGSRIAVDDKHRIWVYEVGGAGRTRLAPENRDYDEGYPVWSADGSRVVYASNETGNWEMYSRVPGAAKSELVAERAFDQIAVAVAPDGTIAFQESNTATGDDIWFLPPGGESRPGVAGPGTDALCDFSPDGRLIAYASDESGQFEIYVRSVLDEGERTQVSTAGGSGPVWSPKVNRLFFRQGADVMAVDVVSRDPLAFSRPHLVVKGGWDLPQGNKNYERTFEVTPDGEHFVMIRHEPEAIPDRINIVLNWYDELDKKVPAGKGVRR